MPVHQPQDLWLNDNALADWPALLEVLSQVRASLACLYLANNPAKPDMAALQVRNTVAPVS